MPEWGIRGDGSRYKAMKENSKRNEERVLNCLHYLKVLQANSAVFQPEVREAVDFAIKFIKDEYQVNHGQDRVRQVAQG